MKLTVQHQVYGQIVLDENAWGKRTLTVNGVTAVPVSKKQFVIDGKPATISGNFLSGLILNIGGESIRLSQKSAWYEILLAFIPFVFLVVWGNSATLCSIFPVVGGALGGGLGGLGFVCSLYLMKKQSSPLFKALIGLGITLATIFVAFLMALFFIALLV